MSLLDLPGPEFLRFFLPYGLGVIALAWLLRAALLGSTRPEGRWLPGSYPRESDAVAIALLRGGRSEAARTLLGRLLSAGWISVTDRKLRSLPEPDEPGPSLSPLEENARRAVTGGAECTASEAEQRIARALGTDLEDVEEELSRQGLLLSAKQKTRLRGNALLAGALVVGLGMAKVVVALDRGRTNVAALVILLAVFTALIFFLLRPPLRTPAGQRYLDWAQEAHRGLLRLLQQGRRDNSGEIALAAGIFGLAAIPGLSALDLALRPEEPQHGGGCGSGTSGVGSCSSGGSGDGGCGGGGCGGGGCGGCGG
ncbi:MAG TPA: hypothetical protein DD490_11725 [Acidobacteria bacterium]|nr:hypothetical protein [Acidobacteriota bacterium]